MLLSSVVSDLSPGLRTGAFIDPREATAWVNHVPCMIRANLPVYICWNAPVQEILDKYPFLSPYVPPSGDILSVTEESSSSLRFRWPSEPTLRTEAPTMSFNVLSQSGKAVSNLAHTDFSPSACADYHLLHHSAHNQRTLQVLILPQFGSRRSSRSGITACERFSRGNGAGKGYKTSWPRTETRRKSCGLLC